MCQQQHAAAYAALLPSVIATLLRPGFLRRNMHKVLFNFYVLQKEGSDYFTENFQVKENKTKMRNIHPRFFQLLFQGSRLGFRLGFGLGFDLGIVLE